MVRSSTGNISLRAVAVLATLALLIVGISILPRSDFGVPTTQRALAPDGSPREVVTVWGWNIAAMSLQSLVPEFEKNNPQAAVDVKMNGTALQSRFLLSMSTGRGGPDISQLQEREAGKYTNTGKLADLTSWAAKYEKDFPANFWASCVGEDGHIYAIPWDIAPCAVFYKRWIFEKHGVDPNTIETWDDFIAAGKQIFERSKGETRLMPISPNGLGQPFQILMLQAGGGIFNAKGEIIFDSVQNRVALKTVRKLLDSGICAAIGTSSGELQVSYNSDSIASYPGAVWMMADMKDSAKSTAGQWGVFRLPALRPGGIRTSNQGGSVLVVPASSEHVEHAAKFVEYSLCTVEAQLKQYQFGLFPGYMPAQRDPRFLNATDRFFGGQRVAELFAQDFEKLPVLVRTRDWDEAEQLINRTLYDWARNGENDDAYLQRIAKTLSERLGRPIAAQ